MILSDETLREMIAAKTIVVEPIESYQIQPASIDLRLGRHFLKIDENTLESLSLDSELPYVKIEKDEIIIPPHSFLLATTVELIRIPSNVTAFVEGRSSIGRMGLFIQNAGWVDPGFEGNITLELFNANRLPLRLSSGRRICQIVFAFMDKATRTPYAWQVPGAAGNRWKPYLQRQGQGEARLLTVLLPRGVGQLPVEGPYLRSRPRGSGKDRGVDQPDTACMQAARGTELSRLDPQSRLVELRQAFPVRLKRGDLPTVSGTALQLPEDALHAENLAAFQE